MKTSMALILALCASLQAQDEGKKKVESPIKKSLGPAPEKFDLARTGIEWNRGLEAAVNKGKPVLLFQLLGNFDDVYC
ncbi:MAG: hypothetical protein HY293_02445 [Planctomycetes bacterium]|nr:hypothetical protein [Planctomycetota bacterium]